MISVLSIPRRVRRGDQEVGVPELALGQGVGHLRGTSRLRARAGVDAARTDGALRLPERCRIAARGHRRVRMAVRVSVRAASGRETLGSGRLGSRGARLTSDACAMQQRPRSRRLLSSALLSAVGSRFRSRCWQRLAAAHRRRGGVEFGKRIARWAPGTPLLVVLGRSGKALGLLGSAAILQIGPGHF